MKKRAFALNILSIIIILFLTNLISSAENNTNDTFLKLNPSVEFSWNDEDIINGKEFDIQVSAFDLSDAKYDVEVFIYKDNNEDKIISESYHTTDWVYSGAYIFGFFTGPGNKTKDVSLRILENYRNFNGSAKIGLIMKKAFSSDVKLELEDVIKILPKGTNKSPESTSTETENLTDSEPETTSVTGEVIKIGSNNANSAASSSGNNLIFYFIIGFVILVVIFLIIFIMRILRRRDKSINNI